MILHLPLPVFYLSHLQVDIKLQTEKTYAICYRKSVTTSGQTAQASAPL